jgi:hypothetical protein
MCGIIFHVVQKIYLWRFLLMFKFHKAGVRMFVSAVLLFSINIAGVSAEKNIEQEGGINFIQADKYITKENKGQRELKYKTSDEIINAYGGTSKKIDLQSLPKDTPVIKVDNLNELDALLASVRSETEKALNQNIVLTPPKDSKINNLSVAAIGDTSTGTSSTVIYAGSTYNLNLHSNYILTNVADGSWAGTWVISHVSPATALSGITIGIGWLQSSISSVKINDYKWITTGSGTLSFVIFVNGIGQVASVPVNGSHNLTL